MSPTLLITNDFPPRVGGIERYCRALVDLLDGDVVVLTSRTPGRRAAERAYDAAQPYRIVRLGPVLLPTPAVARAARALLRASGASRVVFGAAAPLALLAPTLRRAGAERIVACTHGHEVWWARLPGTRAALRRIGSGVDALTVLTGFTRRALEPALTPAVRERIVVLPPPLAAANSVPAHPADPPTVLAVGRLVRRKGFDTLIAAWPLLHHPTARLVVVGTGPDRRRLARLAGASPARDRIELAGGLDDAALAARRGSATVAALPCRTRRGGLEVEGFGYVVAEAQAAGLPVVVGTSGGAPEACDPGRSGVLVDTARAAPRVAAALATSIDELLADPARRAALGAAGRRFVDRFAYPAARRTLRAALALPDVTD